MLIHTKSSNFWGRAGWRPSGFPRKIITILYMNKPSCIYAAAPIWTAKECIKKANIFINLLFT